jgi:stalled ribosome rescue protein Dom34
MHFESQPERTKIINVGDKVAETRLMTIRQKEHEIRKLGDEIQLLKKKIGIYAIGGVPVGDEVLLAGKQIKVDEDISRPTKGKRIAMTMRIRVEKTSFRKRMTD